MDATNISRRVRRQLEKLPPEKRAKAEEAIARTQTPEYQAKETADREAIGREYHETGHIATVAQLLPAEEVDHLKAFPVRLRREREAKGLSLADVADRSGINKSALSRLENGQQINPTLSTLARYAEAIGKRLALSLEEPTHQGVNSLAMKVNIDPAIRNDEQVAPLVDQINTLIDKELGNGAGITTAIWSLQHDHRNRPLFTVILSDAWGQATGSFARYEIEKPEQLRAAIHRLRGKLLQSAAPK